MLSVSNFRFRALLKIKVVYWILVPFQPLTTVGTFIFKSVNSKHTFGLLNTIK